MKQLHMFEEESRLATVYARGPVSYRVWCLDSLTDHQESIILIMNKRQKILPKNG